MNDKEFLAKCRSIDFSDEIPSFEKIKNEESIKMKKTKKLSVAIAAAAIAVMLIPVGVFAAGPIWRYLETRIIAGEGYVNHFSVAETDDGYISSLHMDFDAEGPIVAEIEGETVVLLDRHDFDDLHEAISHLAVENPRLPTYLPDGFVFDRATFNVSPIRNPEQEGSANSMDIHYVNGDNALRLSIMYYPEEWGGMIWSLDLEEVEVNGYHGLIGAGMMSLQIGDTLYLFDYYNSGLDRGQLVVIAEALR